MTNRLGNILVSIKCGTEKNTRKVGMAIMVSV